MGWLDGQVALITGGGSGIGQAIVTRFVQEGARVGVMDRVTARVEKLQAQFGKPVVAIGGDVIRLDDNTQAVARTVDAFGRLDVFVGNAGVYDRALPFTDIPESQLAAAYDELFDVNVKGCLLGAKAALTELQKTSGCMIFTASVAGMNSGGGGVIYTASKHAVIGVIRQLAAELGPGVRVNGVAPGGTRTDLRGLAVFGQDDRTHLNDPAVEERLRASNPLHMMLEPDDLAGAYVFLASPSARGITGSIVTVDAGNMLRMRRR